MADLKFTKATDQKHEIRLDSYLISASWISGMAFVGLKAKFEVRTAFVGNGAKIKVKGKTEKGKKLGKVKGKMQNNIFTGEFEIPEKVGLDDQIYFEVDLSANGLSGESARIPVYPQPKLKSIKWSAEEARRGDLLTLSAELENVKDGTEVKLIIYEFDRDGGHDIITELITTVKESKIEEKWEFEYHEDTDELPTSEEVERYGGDYNPPEYFFTVKIGEFELGKKDQDSGILAFKDWLEIKMLDNNGQPVCNVKYKLTLPDGQERQGTIGAEGFAREDNITPGKCLIEFEDTDSRQSST
ncbi:MAG: hypothetical protein DRP51_03900 [Candidatus Zixiibacteriota bacterium]|nr:MAG: hypothetical protein DRP51_03900 [candidate division Zixibacteria bacterium]